MKKLLLTLLCLMALAIPSLQASKYKLVTNSSEIETGTKYILAYVESNGVAHVMNKATTSQAALEGTKTTVANNTITDNDNSLQPFTLGNGYGTNASGKYTLQYEDGQFDDYLSLASNKTTALKLVQQKDNTTNVSISIDSEYYAAIKFTNYNNRIIRWGTSDFRAYSDGSDNCYLYKLTDDQVESGALGEITFSPAPDSDGIITITEGESITISCQNATYIGYSNSEDFNDYGYEQKSSFTYTPTGDVSEFKAFAGNDTDYTEAPVMIIVEKRVVYDAYEYTLVTSASEITDGGKYVFVGGSNSAPYVSTTIEKPSDKYNTFISAIADGVSVSEGELGKAGSVIKVVPSQNDNYAGATNMVFTKVNDKYSVKFSDDNMFLNTGKSNTECAKSATAESFTVRINSDDNTLYFANSSNQMYFNSQSPRFKFYSASQGDAYLYKLTNVRVNMPTYSTEELEDYDNKEYIDGFYIYLEASEDCTIYATTNGDAPTAANNELEDDMLMIESGNVDLRAIAVKPNGAKSEELNVSFKHFSPSDYSDTHIAYSAAEGFTPDMIHNPGSNNSTGRGTMLCIETEPEAKENAKDTYSTTYVLSSPDAANSRINAVKAARRADGKIYIEKNSTDHGHQEFYIGTDNNEGYYFWCMKEGKLLVLATEIGNPNLFLESIAEATANGHEYICTFETSGKAANAPHRSISSNKETSPVTISFKGEKIAHGVDNGNYHFTSSSTGSSSIRLYAGENSNTTAIDSITSESDSNAGIEYYNLQGNRVAEPANGIYIRRQGNTAVKVAL